MITKSMFNESNSHTSLLSGELYLWTNGSNMIHSAYSPSFEPNIIEDDNFEFLINFLNKDITKLNTSIKEAIITISENYSNKVLISNIFKDLAKELINWHPYFKYNISLYLGDIIVSYILKLDINTSEFLHKLLHYILSSEDINTLINHHIHLLNFLNAYGNNNLTNIPINPLDELEEIQTYIKKNIPQKRPDKNRYEWDLFISNLCENYGEIYCSHHKIYKSSSSLSNSWENSIKDIFINCHSTKDTIETSTNQISLLELIENSTPLEYNNIFEYIEPKIGDDFYKFEITSFTQYLQAMLIQLSSTKCSIKYCTQCLQYFLDIPSLKHNHSDYIEEMIKIRNKAYQKVYKSYERYAYGDVELGKYDFYQFHSQTYALAIREKIPLNKYSSYTTNENYSHKGFQSFPSILDYKE